MLQPALALLSLLAGPAASTTSRNAQLSYHGSTYCYRLERSGTGFLEEHGDGFVPAFSIDRRDRRRPPSDGEIMPRLLDGAASRGSAIVLGLARLNLPSTPGGSWFLYHRAEGRRVALELDLTVERNSLAARTCLMVEVRPLPGATRERCSIRAVVDRQGWPIVAEVSRMLDGADRTRAMESVTLVRSR